MKANKNIVSLEVAKLLRDTGYNEYCHTTYCKVCRVSDEIMQKYPGLSDSGYRDLEYEKNIKKSEIYKTYKELTDVFYISNKNGDSYIGNNFIAVAPTIFEVQQWLWEKYRIFVNSTLYSPFEEPYKFFYWVDYPKETYDCFDSYIDKKEYPTYQQAFNEGLKKVLKDILKEMKLKKN